MSVTLKYMYDDGGSNTAPYDTMAKASTTLATIIAIPLAAGEAIAIGHDTAGEGLTVNTTYIFTGTAASPNYLISMNRADLTAMLAGAIINISGAVSLIFQGSVYVWGITFNVGATSNNTALQFGNTSINKQVIDNCKITFLCTGSLATLKLGGVSTALGNNTTLKNSTIKYGATAQSITVQGGFILIDNCSFDGTGSAPTKLIGSLAGTVGTIIQNCDWSAGAQGIVLFPAISSYGTIAIIRNCKLPASWNGTLVTGGVVTSPNLRCEMYNCDSADTNYRILINDYYGQLQSETTLVATGGATDGTTRLSHKIITTANANQVNPFETPEIMAWNDTEGTQRTCTVEIIHNAVALLKDNEAWIEVDYSADTGDPLYAKATDCTADLIVATPANQTASTKAWDDLISARQNSYAYVLNDLIKSANNPGRVFICTTAGTTAGSEPAGYGTAVDGGTVADGATCVFTAMWRQKLSVQLPASKPANKGCIHGTVKIGKASTTLYVDPLMRVT